MADVVNSRAVAVKLLCRIEDGGAYSNILLDEQFRRTPMNPQDRRFCAALFYGTLERRYTLDEIIKYYSKNPYDKLNLEVRCILRTALYQILYMNSVPESAAVNEAVKLASKNRNPAVKGFVNGLLRGFLRADKKMPSYKDKYEQLAFDYSCPIPLVKKWTIEYGEDVAIQMLEGSLGRPPITAKVNTLRTTTSNLISRLYEEGIECSANQYFDDCIDIANGSPESTKAFKDGLFHVQDISSRLCCKALDVKSGDTLLDVCAAPGGKTFTASELMNNNGKVYSLDLHKNRVKLIQSGCKRLGLDIVNANVNDAKIYNSSLPMADVVLCDLPCSGLGVIARKPEIKYNNLTDFERLPYVQHDILECCSKYVKVGGTLVFSTCTLSRAENDENTKRFLAEHNDFEPAPLWQSFGHFDGYTSLTVLPSYFGSDGFYISKFIRTR
ncbi:MAG: 16S rRNA (cytosine(967)-C(5))-methyltransferase RsmB [Ruminococcus sp.]|nr:16S rRNA (cytosine(967)-C(5))-methyltransferase RsmB [Ruminococcus sp.]